MKLSGEARVALRERGYGEPEIDTIAQTLADVGEAENERSDDAGELAFHAHGYEAIVKAATRVVLHDHATNASKPACDFLIGEFKRWGSGESEAEK